jgi:hypothetical protein
LSTDAPVLHSSGETNVKNLSLLSTFLILLTVVSGTSALQKSQEHFTSHQQAATLTVQVA